MKIAMVGDYPLDEQKIDGGVQAVMVILANNLSKIIETEIHIIAPKRDIKEDIFFKKGNIYYHFFPKFKLFGYSPLELSIVLGIDKRKIFKQLQQIKPAIVHCQDYVYSYLCKNSPFPTIITPHGMPQLEGRYKRIKLARFRTWLLGILSDWLFSRRVKYVILISEFCGRMIKISDQARRFIIPNPVKSDFFLLKNREIKGRLLFVANEIYPLKNPLIILKALLALKNDFPEISLHIVGSLKNQDFFNLLSEFVSINQISEHVKFLGQLTEDEVIREYEECSLFTLTSEHENLPMVVLQAMAAGKAIISTRVGGVPEIIQDGITGLVVETGDLDALTKGIKMLLLDENLRDRLGKAAKVEALKRYKGEEIARRTYEVYLTVLRDFLRENAKVET